MVSQLQYNVATKWVRGVVGVEINAWESEGRKGGRLSHIFDFFPIFLWRNQILIKMVAKTLFAGTISFHFCLEQLNTPEIERVNRHWGGFSVKSGASLAQSRKIPIAKITWFLLDQQMEIEMALDFVVTCLLLGQYDYFISTIFQRHVSNNSVLHLINKD